MTPIYILLICSFFFRIDSVQAAESVESSSEVQHPEWVKRLDYSLQWETDRNPIVYLETIVPLYQDLSKTDTVFFQPRVSIQNRMGIYNYGFGYRRLLFDENLLAGINGFYDYQHQHRHQRAGVGLEAIGKRAELRFNSYFGISRTYTVSVSPSETFYERAVNGIDLEAGTPIPYLPFAKIFYSGFWYDFKKSTKNMKGDQWRLELKPSKYLTLDIETFDDNKGGREYRARLAMKFPFDTFSLKTFFADLKTTEPYPDVHLRERTLDPVERNMNIQVEKWKDVGGVSVEVGRT